MPTTHADFAEGIVSGCTAEDRPALWDLCRAIEPGASIQEIGGSLQDADFRSWAVYRDRHRQIRVAVYVHTNGGAVHVVMNPEDSGEPEVREGFLRLMREVSSVNRNTDLMILCPAILRPFVESLKTERFLSEAVYTVHMMHFTPAGEIGRAS